ncbi:hypothetical protein ACFT9I_06190 [Streptomyces sp. NPDC057137]|uniref:hypothetical protein n=1 Tax=Streptomyces sp. NPDC057137 TaxID=3346030 RepID=UPI003641FDA9
MEPGVEALGLAGEGAGVVGGQRHVPALQRLAAEWRGSARDPSGAAAQRLGGVEHADDVGAGVDLGVVAGQDAAQAGRVGDDGPGEAGAVVEAGEAGDGLVRGGPAQAVLVVGGQGEEVFAARIRIPGDWKNRFRTTSYSNIGEMRNGVPASRPTSRSHSVRPLGQQPYIEGNSVRR